MQSTIRNIIYIASYINRIYAFSLSIEDVNVQNFELTINNKINFVLNREI